MRTVISVLLISVCTFPIAAAAYQKQSINFDANKTYEQGTQLGSYENIANGGPVVTVSLMINLLLQVLGVFSLALVVYGGWLWIIARGDQERITKAKDLIIGATIGLFIILASYSISQAIFRQFVSITN